MKELIMKIMKENFDVSRIEEELEEIIVTTMDELYHDVAHQILADYDPEELLYEVASEELDCPF